MNGSFKSEILCYGSTLVFIAQFYVIGLTSTRKVLVTVVQSITEESHSENEAEQEDCVCYFGADVNYCV